MIKEKHYDPVFHSQSHFRSILDSMARPGKLNPIERVDIYPIADFRKSTASVVFALVNRDVSFQVLGFSGDVIDYIKANRNSELVSTEQADFIVHHGFPNPATVEAAKEGILTYPETSATIIAQISEVAEHPFEGALKVVLSGPGNAEDKAVYFKDANPDFFEALSAKNSEFPLGIDIIFTTAAIDAPEIEQVLCIPRSSKIRVEY